MWYDHNITLFLAQNSDFQVIVGRIELGPRKPELVKVAALQNEHVFVTSDRQTVVVTAGVNIRLDWSRWVNETLGESASNASYTILRTQLNEFGKAIGPTIGLTLSRLPKRTVVNLTEFYVEIICVVADNTSDSDRANYGLEACPRPVGSEECFTSKITLYAIERPESLRTLCRMISYFSLF